MGLGPWAGSTSQQQFPLALTFSTTKKPVSIAMPYFSSSNSLGFQRHPWTLLPRQPQEEDAGSEPTCALSLSECSCLGVPGSGDPRQ